MRLNRILLFMLTISLLCTSLGCQNARAADNSAADQASDADFLQELTFLGDSTTAHMQQRSRLSADRIWATKNRYLNLDSRITYAKILLPDGNECTIAEAAQALRPTYLVITLGVDYGVYYYRNDLKTFRYYYEKLLDAIHTASPDTVMVLQSIFLVGRNATVITNEMIANANEVVCAIARDRNLVFIDQTQTLSDKQGYLRPEYCYSEDGIHLTASAYDAILKTLSLAEARIRGHV